ncbi:mucin-binding protein, partial [Lactobacillus xujianguonis]|uniref:mucin-binding protein n=1 Tax=Lactobacillus xujianguonis TaxID=2495899 RepID=UPI00143D5554
SNGFDANGTKPSFDNVKGNTQNFYVTFKHGTVPVTPDNPGTPGQEVPNPNDPNNPHTIPDNFIPQTLTKTVIRDVTYVYEDGSQAEAAVHQIFTFNGNGVVDLVTGQLVTLENGKITGAGKITWNADNHDFEATKAIDTTQYNIVKVSENNTSANVDMSNGVVASETITPNSQNSSVVITLAKKEAPTPDDITVVGKQVVHYVDEQGNKLRDDNTNDTFVFTKPGKTGQWNETSHKYANANAVVIDGYVSDQKTYEGKTATPEDANKEITIVYHKIGKIIPVDPSGNPIPDAPAPGYHNDPNDPSKVTPNEPTPNVPGWTTDVPNVTPEVPTKDTEVPYTKNEVPTPDQGSIEIVVHDNTTNTDLSNYGKESGKQNVGINFNFDKSTLIKDLEDKGYKVMNPDVEIPSVVTKGDQKIVIYVESKEEPKDPITPEVPNLPVGDDNNNLPVPDKKETSIPTQPTENESTPNVEKVSVTTHITTLPQAVTTNSVYPKRSAVRNKKNIPASKKVALPQTGKKNNFNLTLAGTALLGLASVFSLVGLGDKRKKNK